MSNTKSKKRKQTGSKAISVWFDKKFHSKLKARAKSQGRSVSNYLCWLVKQDCKQAEAA